MLIARSPGLLSDLRAGAILPGHACPRGPASIRSPSGPARIHRGGRGKCAAVSIPVSRSVTALLGKLCQARKNLAVTANQVQARQNNGDERCREEKIKLPLHAIVNLSDTRGGQLFTFVISD